MMNPAAQVRLVVWAGGEVLAGMLSARSGM